jgi:ubiquitin thioesterase protein OTUB1
MALINYINIPIRIYYLDGNVGNQDATIFQIPEDSPADSVFINLLYRPGHYDILYQE